VKFLPKLVPNAVDGLAMNADGLPDLGNQLDHVRLEPRTVGVTIIHLRRLRTPPAARTMPS
jgi:hypothetical protein